MALQTKTVSTGDYAWKSWSNGYVITLTLTEESIQITDNTSRVGYQFTISNTCNNRFYSYDYNWNISIGGQTIPITGFDFDLSKDYTTQVIASGQITVQHDADGGLDMPYAVSIPNVQNWNSYGPPAMELTGFWALTKIPRASTIGATDANIGAVSMIAVSKKQEAFTHSVAYRFLNLAGYVAADGTVSDKEEIYSGTSIPFIIPETFYGQIPGAASGACTLVCRTYSGSTQVGQEQQAQFTVYANPELCKPIVTGRVEDVASKTLALTGDAAKLVRFYSTAACTIAAEAVNGATIAETRIQGTVVTDSCRIPEAECEEVTFWAKDSRGFQTTHTVKPEMIPYVKLTCNPAASRIDPTGSDVLLTMNGNCFFGSFGAEENKLQLWYRVDGGEFTEIKPIVMAQSYSASVQLGGLDYRRTYTIEVVAEDKLERVSKLVVVRPGIPVFDWGEHDFAFHVPVSGPSFNGVEAGVEIKCKDLVQTDGLQIKTQFAAFDGFGQRRQTFLILGSNNGSPVFGMLTVSDSGEALWSGQGTVTWEAMDSGRIKLQLEQNSSDRLLCLSGGPFHLWNKDAVMESFAVLGTGMLGTMVLGKEY